MGKQLTIRQAQQSDKVAVLKFCEHTFDWGDYIPNVWDRWLNEKQARLFTATINSRPIGIMRVALQKPREAWLQAARIDPQHRREGVATELTKTCMQWARERGAIIFRLGTDSDNHVAQKVLTKLNFKKVSDFLIMECENLQEDKAENCRWARPADLDNAWAFLKTSKTFKASAHLYTSIFEWISLELEDLKKFIDNQKTIIHESNNVIDGIVLVDEAIKDAWEEPALQTCYIDGTIKSIKDTINLLKTYTNTQGMQKIYAFACNTQIIVKALTESSFTRDELSTEFIYQKEI